jgi:ATP-dependent helicase/nuclease subunit A
MDHGTLTIYSASAGSGKTFRLAAIYLARLFRSRYAYRKILAVTFTNKATAEMKGRILDQLHCLASGDRSDYLEDLIKETGKSEENIRLEAGEILFAILHDFSRFSVCTIDAFFQKVIRAFAREHGLHSGFSIELDYSEILSSAVDEMIASSAGSEQLRNWLKNYIEANLDDEKTWNLKDEISKLAEELFREKFKILSSDEKTKLEDKEFLVSYIGKLRALRYSFESELKNLGQKCMRIFSDHGLSDDMFYYKSKGVPGFIRALAEGSINEPNSYVRLALTDPPRWASGITDPSLENASEKGLADTLRKAILFYDRDIKVYNTAEAILKNVYALGILSDVLRKIRDISTAGNNFLIADAGELLSLITGGDQAPFIYEKIGNRFENYMIDEFQDTSFLQWKNFRTLIDESMAGGHDNLVVGDIKQSIYRFRNSDWQILGQMKDEIQGNERLVGIPLKTNWRSRLNIIRFNNSIFSFIPASIDRSALKEGYKLNFSSLYSEAVQEDPGRKPGGYIRIEFIDDEKDNSDQGNCTGRRKITKRWQETVLEKLPHVIETYLDKGYKPSDIGILVREGREGTAVMNTIIEYNNYLQQDKRRINIVSNDSLMLSNSHAIIFIISTLKLLDDPDDSISMAQMVRFYLLSTGHLNADNIPLNTTGFSAGKNNYLPEGYEVFLEQARRMTLFEATESIIGFFGLGKFAWNVSYLSAFQDWVLNYSGNKNADFKSFLEWWDTTGSSKSVILPATSDAVKIFTIHKSKGLEFGVVLIPFISWNLGHKASQHPVLWLKPQSSPFDELGIVPVMYQKGLLETIFANDYLQEKYAAYLDNLNLLYVAMTRAIDAIYGFAPESPGSANGIAGLIKEAVSTEENLAGKSGISTAVFYNRETRIFEFGEIPEIIGGYSENITIPAGSYLVSARPESLRLKLHGENYFTAEGEDKVRKINYGNMMHEIFEGIGTSDDIPEAVRRLVLEGKITESESALLEIKLKALVSTPVASEWFKPGIKVLKEAGILLPSGTTLRPDRVIIKDKAATIIDFKFGQENPEHAGQVKRYGKQLKEMGFKDVDAFLWYVDRNKIIPV